MKKVIKIAGGLLLMVILLISGALIYLKAALPDTGDAPELSIEITPERVERGEYLANYVFVCIDCHSTRDFSKFSGPLVAGTYGKGGERFGVEMGLPGNFYSKNLTPYHLGDWTDGEIFKAITTGVNKDGRALFPIMPYLSYGKADKEDIYDIIAYLRTLEPIEYDVPESEPVFPMNFILNTIPRPASFTTKPDKSDKIEYGRYLVSVASCRDCHTPQAKGEPVAELNLAGGFEFLFPSGEIIRSANITPDLKTGIGSWSEDQFVQRFKAYADTSTRLPEVVPGQFNSIMPWSMYGQMKEEDLRAVYAYLRTVPPIEHSVVRFEPAK